MNPHDKNLILSTLGVYRESTDKRKTELKDKLKWNLENFPIHKNVRPTEIFLRTIKNMN